MHRVQRIGRPPGYADHPRPVAPHPAPETTAPAPRGEGAGAVLGGCGGHTIELCRDNDRVRVRLRGLLVDVLERLSCRAPGMTPGEPVSGLADRPAGGPSPASAVGPRSASGNLGHSPARASDPADGSAVALRVRESGPDRVSGEFGAVPHAELGKDVWHVIPGDYPGLGAPTAWMGGGVSDDGTLHVRGLGADVRVERSAALVVRARPSDGARPSARACTERGAGVGRRLWDGADSLASCTRASRLPSGSTRRRGWSRRPSGCGRGRSSSVRWPNSCRSRPEPLAWRPRR
jgi:hypothetical protein